MKRLAAIVVVGVLAALPLAGCGGDDGTADATAPATTTTTTAASSAVSADKVEIADYKFMPDVIQVDAGTKVTFTNSDDTKHTATADDGSFDTGDLDEGDNASVTLNDPGEFTYYCRYHPFMKGTVQVQ